MMGSEGSEMDVTCQIMSDHSGSRELCICRQVICDALQVQRKHHGEDRV